MPEPTRPSKFDCGLCHRHHELPACPTEFIYARLLDYSVRYAQLYKKVLGHLTPEDQERFAVVEPLTPEEQEKIIKGGEVSQ